MNTTTHLCAAPGCKWHIAHEMMMCATHWQMVPEPIKQRVRTAYQRRNRTGWIEARRDAVAAVSDAEAVIKAKRAAEAAQPKQLEMI